MLKLIEAHQSLDSVNLNEILNSQIFNRDHITMCPNMVLFFLKLMPASISLFNSSTLYALSFSLLTFAYELLAPTQTASALLPEFDIAAI